MVAENGGQADRRVGWERLEASNDQPRWLASRQSSVPRFFHSVYRTHCFERLHRRRLGLQVRRPRDRPHRRCRNAQRHLTAGSRPSRGGASGLLSRARHLPKARATRIRRSTWSKGRRTGFGLLTVRGRTGGVVCHPAISLYARDAGPLARTRPILTAMRGTAYNGLVPVRKQSGRPDPFPPYPPCK